MSCRCKCCGRRFRRRPQNPDQQYCSRRHCQNKRRQRWRRAKLCTDAVYRDNQRDSQRRWIEQHPDYWRRYRAAHPDYVARNRSLQHGRDRLKRDLDAVTRTGALLAKSDACEAKSEAITVYYELLPAESSDLAKRYVSKRIFQLIPIGYGDFLTNGPSCKETTRETFAEKFGTPDPCARPSP